MQPQSILPLTLNNIALIRDGQKLLDDISLIVPRGGVTALVGPNGAGKSLLLRLCHGLIDPDIGTLHWTNPTPMRHAMVFQQPVMLRRSVRDNILHALASIKHPASKARTQTALERFSLEPLADRPARLLSGGEKQRVAIARAWSLSPELLFLDEPTSQLDPGATREIENIIAGLAQDGLTICMATHDLGQARRLAQRILFLHRGRLIEDRAAVDFFSKPTTPEATAFLAGELLR